MARRHPRLSNSWSLAPSQPDRMHRDLELGELASHSNAQGPWVNLAMSTNAALSVTILFFESQRSGLSALKGTDRGNLLALVMRRLLSRRLGVSLAMYNSGIVGHRR